MAGSKLTKEQIAEFKESFDVFDQDGNGNITATELGDVMRKLGQSPTDEELKSMIADVDADKSGNITFDEFLTMMGAYSQTSEADKIECAFKAFDKDGNGLITRSELKEAMSKLGGVSDAEIDQMIRNADGDGDGKVNYKEFAKMMAAKK